MHTEGTELLENQCFIKDKHLHLAYRIKMNDQGQFYPESDKWGSVSLEVDLDSFFGFSVDRNLFADKGQQHKYSIDFHNGSFILNRDKGVLRP